MATCVLFGLGNPGRRYAETRHNAGWQVLDVLAERHGGAFKRTRLLHGEVADVRFGGSVVRMVKPASFMNLLGPVYVRALEVFDVEPVAALAVVDEFMLPFGRIRLGSRGSAGGHNGLKSLEQALGTREYPRLRLGIGPVPEPQDPADFVLRRYDAVQKRGLAAFLDRAADAAEGWVRDGMDEAMNRFNAGET